MPSSTMQVIEETATTPGKYWNDATYARFYESNVEEQRIMKNRTGGAGLTPAGNTRLADTWRRHGVGMPGPVNRPGGSVSCGVDIAGPSRMLSERRLAQFQKSFAELSNGQDWIRVGDAASLLRSMGTGLPSNVIRRLAREAATANGDVDTKMPVRLTYDLALRLYELSLSPGPSDTVSGQVIDDFLDDALVSHVRSVPDPSDTLESCASVEQNVDTPNLVSPKLTPNCSATAVAPETEHQPSSLRGPPRQKPRGPSIFKKIGRFTIREAASIK